MAKLNELGGVFTLPGTGITIIRMGWCDATGRSEGLWAATGP